MAYLGIGKIKAMNKAAGLYWFSRDTMRFFNSRIEKGCYCGKTSANAHLHFFVTSEMFETSYPGYYRADRRYSVRVFDERDCSIDTLGEFQAFRRADVARAVARQAAESYTGRKD